MLHKARTLFVSDVHLGTPSSQAAHLLRLLDEVSVDQLVLVGDIIDLTSMQARAWWHPLHTACVQRVLKLAREGTKVVYVPGNHDAELRQHVGCEIQGVRIERTVDYRALDGSIYRVAHGDEFDRTGKGHAPWIEALGESLYEVITWMNRVYNQARCSFDLEYHPVSLDIKKRVRRAMAFIEAFENRVIEGTKPLPVDGYIGGHI
ncbi:MAG: UDP-2,3-diacylglucosamine diphosphatase, partial [Pseudomonadota bacterium]